MEQSSASSMAAAWSAALAQGPAAGASRRDFEAHRRRLGLASRPPRNLHERRIEAQGLAGEERCLLLVAGLLACDLPSQSHEARAFADDLLLAAQGCDRATWLLALLAATQLQLHLEFVAGGRRRPGCMPSIRLDHHVLHRLALGGMASCLMRDPAARAAVLTGQADFSPQLRLWDAVEAGRCDEVAEVLRTGFDGGGSSRLLNACYISLAELCAGTLAPGGDAAVLRERCQASVATITAPLLAAHVRLAWLSVCGRETELRRALDEVEDAWVLTTSSLLALAPVRAALRLGDHRAAERWLDLRKRHGLSSPADAALRMALYVLTGESHFAGRCAGRLAADMEAFGCAGRIDLELRAIPRLSPARLLGVLGGAHEPIPAPMVHPSGPLIEGSSPIAADLRARIARCAASSQPVLIEGPQGSGRSTIARAIHEGSRQAGGPLMFATAELASDVELLAELAGTARKPRGLIARAGRGTLVVERVELLGEGCRNLLAGLLEHGTYRSLGGSETRRARCRILCTATIAGEDGPHAVPLHPTLATRLRRIVLRVPGLAERSEDIVSIADSLLATCGGGRTLRWSSSALAALARQPWPGNIRELRATIESMLLYHPHVQIFSAEHAGLAPTAAPSSAPAAATHPSLRRPDRLEELRRICRERGRITRAETIALLDVAPGTAAADLRLLERQGELRRCEPTPARYSHYYLWVGRRGA